MTSHLKVTPKNSLRLQEDSRDTLEEIPPVVSEISILQLLTENQYMTLGLESKSTHNKRERRMTNCQVVHKRQWKNRKVAQTREVEVNPQKILDDS